MLIRHNQSWLQRETLISKLRMHMYMYVYIFCNIHLDWHFHYVNMNEVVKIKFLLGAEEHRNYS